METNFGNCFEDAGRSILHDVVLGDVCHGIVLAKADPEDEAKYFVHAWVELKNENDDFIGLVFETQGRNIFPTSIYYAQLNIDKSDVKRYNREEVCFEILRKKHWGPWEDHLLNYEPRTFREGK